MGKHTAKSKCYVKFCRSKELQETYIGDKIKTMCKTHLIMSLKEVSSEAVKQVDRAINTNSEKRYIFKAINAHDALVEACKALLAESGRGPARQRACELGMEALKLAGGV